MRRAALLAVFVLVVSALLSVGASASVNLSGDYLQVGVGSGGVLVNDELTLGVKLDPNGTGSYSIADFTLPGTPFEFYSLGVGGTYVGTSVPGWDSFGGSTVDQSWDGQRNADTSARWDGLGIYQNMWFNADESTIHFLVTLTNTNANTTLENVAYARGADPDQDVFTYSDFNTNNTIDASGVTGTGPWSGWTMTLKDVSGGGVYSVTGWSQDPYALLAGGNVGNGDYTIGCAWDLGSIAPGAEKSVAFDYIFTAPGLPAFALVGVAPVLGALIRRRKR